MRRAWSLSFLPFVLLTLIISLSHVQAGDGIGNPPVLKPNLAANTSAPSSSQILPHAVNILNSEKERATSALVLTPSSSAAPAVKSSSAAKHSGTEGTTVPTNSTTPGLAETGPLAGQSCRAGAKRSWIFRGRTGAYLHVRGCLPSFVLEPVAGLIPNPNAPSESASTPQPASSSEPQAAKDTQQTVSQAAKDSRQTDSQQPDSHSAQVAPQMNPQAAKDTPQTDSQSSPAAPQVNPQPAKDTPQPDSQSAQVAPQVKPQPAKDTPQTDSQPAKGGAQVDSQPAMPAVAPGPTDTPVVVQGQTVPANGNPITISNQLVRVSSGSIYVGSSAAPIPQAQAVQLHAEPIVAGSLTFLRAPPSPLPQVAPPPIVVGGLTFSAAPSEPSVESNTTPDQAQARPVIVGGKIYAPVETSPAAANTAGQRNPEPSSSQDPSSNAVNNDHTEPAQLNPHLAQADSKPIVIGGMTYTPVAANPTPSPQSAAVFSFDGIALTQGGKAVTISGARISLGPSGVVVGTSSLLFSTPAPTPALTTSLLTIGSQTLTALRGSEGGFEIGHSTLLPGSTAASIGGTRYSINKPGSLIVGTSTIALATAGTSNMSDNALTAGGETFTPLGSTAVAIDGTTLSIGGSAITEDGTRLSLASNGLLVGSSTFAYPTPVADIATVSTASSTLSTSVSPSGGAIPTAIPSVTGGVGRSAASANTVTPRVRTIWFGISMSLSMVIGSL